MLCEFCEEFHHRCRSRFAQIYAPFVKDRVVARHGIFVAMPTMGQLFPNSLLVLPASHVETMASLPASELSDLTTFLTALEKVIGQNRPVVAFEHGARCTTGGGCGIYHAHVHLVAVPAHVSVDDLLPPEMDSRSYRSASSFIAGLRDLRSSPEYLIVRDSNYLIRFVDISLSSGKRYPSQYFRRVLTEFFKLDHPWDWRRYQGPEQYLFDTINMFRNANVSLCK